MDTNTPEFSVGEIAAAIRQTLEVAFARVRVRGEVTEAKTYASGHTYFSLKDGQGKLRAVIWRRDAAKLAFMPENGTEVVATGRVSAYQDRSEYQLVVEQLDYAGIGAVLARIERLRVALAAEGLFDAARKRPIPQLPALIAVITSAQGAVLHDIRTTVARRFPRPMLVWPVPVQGQDAAARIAAALAGIDRLPVDGIPRPDVLIVARGGGSLEDLMAFNEEVVVRAAAACGIPLISAVGHETDVTLLDHVADQRAPTPTAAAELAVPARAALVAALAQTTARLAGSHARTTEARRHRLAAAGARLPDLPAVLEQARLRLDERGQRLDRALPALAAARRAALVAIERRIVEPRAALAARRAQVDLLAVRHRAGLVGAVQRARRAAAALARLSPASLRALLAADRARLALGAATLEGLSYASVLARGFALVRDPAGVPLTRAAAIRGGDRLRLTFQDGELAATADRQRVLPL